MSLTVKLIDPRPLTVALVEGTGASVPALALADTDGQFLTDTDGQQLLDAA